MIIFYAKVTISSISPLSGCNYVSNQLITEITPKIFQKLGGGAILIKKHSLVFEKKSHFVQIWPNMLKMAVLAQNHSFFGSCKVCPKVVL